VATDVDRLLAVHEGFFDSADEIERYAHEAGLFLYESPAGELLGCGLIKRITPWRDEVDVGMLVAPAHRGRGLGAQIVGDLAARCREVGGLPVCGCDVDNLASRTSLERAGFRSEHRLLEFTFRGT
jgi:RimJ/RimL family protein N-acetyltransferase